MPCMTEHNFNQRKARLERLIEQGQLRVALLAQRLDDSPGGKRVRTLAARALSRYQADLRELFERYRATN